MSIDSQMVEVRRLDQSGGREAALALVEELIRNTPDESRLRVLEGSLHAKNGNYKAAIQSMNTAIHLSPQCRFYFQRGRYHFILDKYSEAIKNFGEALSRDDYNEITFTQELYFHRAEALIKLGKKQEALSDISHIPDGYQTWIVKLRSKNDLMMDCSNL